MQITRVIGSWVCVLAIGSLHLAAMGQQEPIVYTSVEQAVRVSTTVNDFPIFPGGPLTLENDEVEQLLSGSESGLDVELRSAQSLNSSADAFGRFDIFSDTRLIRADVELRASATLGGGETASASGAYTIAASFTATEATLVNVQGRFELFPDGGEPASGIAAVAAYSVFGFNPAMPGSFVSFGTTIGFGTPDRDLDFFETFEAVPGGFYSISVSISVGAGADDGGPASGEAAGTLSFRASFGDRDADGLLDIWEDAGGIDVDADGVIDIPLPNANPDKKDIYVELDRSPGGNYSTDAIDDVIAAFAAAPADAVKNPDGSDGIRLHVIFDEFIDGIPMYNADPVSLVASITDDFRGTAAERSATNRDALLAARAAAYRYCIYGGAASDASDGWGEIGGDQFIVTLDGPSNNNNRENQASTFMHELGHTLGLRHGGYDDFNNKPNYFSVMNYAHAFPGLFYQLDFSRARLESIDERNLDESAGLGPVPAVYADSFFAYNTTPVVLPMGGSVLEFDVASGAKDWNGDFDFNDTGLQIDLNNINSSPNSILEVHVSAEDWSRLLIPLRGGNGNYGYLAGFGSRTGGGETTEIYDSDKPAAFGRLLAKLTGGCRVDIDADGTVDVFDVIAFLRLYDDGDLAADFDADGVLTQADVMFFTTEADAGCQ